MSDLLRHVCWNNISSSLCFDTVEILLSGLVMYLVLGILSKFLGTT